MAVMGQLINQHLLWRGGFGPMAEQLAFLGKTSRESVIESLFKGSSRSVSMLQVADSATDGLVTGIGDISRLSVEEKKAFRQKSREDIKSLNLLWLEEMISSGHQLREKMAFFWHGHFASRNLNVFYQQQLLHVIRTNALGSFRTLLHEVSKSAAMMNFLNNNQNRKGRPNENFAREVMELFTLGRGQYSETDIREAARAFTGWGSNLAGEFVFRPFQHDSNSKTLFGKTGNFKGEDVLDIILDRKETAYFITKKIYRFFVNENVDDVVVVSLANDFFKSDYDIKSLMLKIFSSAPFYDETNIGTRVKSPVELIVGIRRMIPMQLANDEIQLMLQRLLGQVLFYPPNVGGWPGGKNWIDSSTLLVRLRTADMLAGVVAVNQRPKSDDDQMMGRVSNDDESISQSQIRWQELSGYLSKISKDDPEERLMRTLLQTKKMPAVAVLNQSREGNITERIKSEMLAIMRMPEYQLC